MRRLATYTRLSSRCGSKNRSTSVGDRGVQPGCKRSESGCGALPAQLVHIVEECDVSPKCGECTKKQCVFPLPRQGVCEGRVGHFYMPLKVVRGNGFEMAELRE